MATSQQNTSTHITESNEVLRHKFQGLHTKVVDSLSVTLITILGFLFERRVIGVEEMRRLKPRGDGLEQSGDLLILLHSSHHPDAFVQLYLAIKNEPQLHWFVNQIDNYSDPPLIGLLEKLYINTSKVGYVDGSLSEGNTVWGVTFLDSLLYVLRDKSTEHIEVYDIDSYTLQRHITVTGLVNMSDIIACAHHRCLYVSGGYDKYMHRVRLQPDANTIKWPVDDVASALSLTNTHGVLLMCYEVGKIKEFSTEGKLLREVQLAPDIVSPHHAIQLSDGQLVVCHGRGTDPAHRVCLVGSDGHVVQSYGGPKGAGGQLMNGPVHLAVDRNGFVFVADVKNRRVLLLSPALTYVREVVTSDQLRWEPLRLCLDIDRRLLYVADCLWKRGKLVAGRLVFVSV